MTGSRHLTSRQLNLSGVADLAVGAGFVVRVRIGESEEATIWMDDNLTDLVDATVTGGRLSLGLKPDVKVRNATLVAEITVRNLDQLTAGGVSQVTLAPELTGAALRLEAGGASHITGRLRVETVVAVASGTSTLALSGQVRHLTLDAKGTSELALSELAVRDLDAVLSGASCAAVAVSDTLAAQTSGTSALRYSGAPRITREQTSGVSSITPEASHGDRCGP
ncbi:MAG: GIN domain-containing protein [Pseudonocardiaceae bacterium]